MVRMYTSWCFTLFSCFALCVSILDHQQSTLPAAGMIPSYLVSVADAEGGITLLDCPKNISTPSDAGKSWARVTWKPPRFLDRENNAVISVRTHAPGDRFSVGNTIVRYSVAKKGTPKCNFAVHVTDEEPPRLMNCPTDITLPADKHQNSVSNVRWESPYATDNVRLFALESTHTSGASFHLGRTEVTYYARDTHGNSAQCSFSVYVTDQEDPVPVACPDDISETVGPTETRKSVTWRTPVFRDNSGTPQLTSTHMSGQPFSLGHTAVVYTATDLSGNRATCSFHVMLKVQVPNHRIFVRHFTTTQIEITWAQTMNKNASSYLIYVWNIGSGIPLASDHVYFPINRQETFATLTLAGLYPGVKYNIRVVITGIRMQLTTRQRTKPSSPGSLTVTPGTLTPVSASLAWQSGGGVFDQYRLSYRKIGSEILHTMRTLDKTTTNYDVDGLDPGTAYVFKVVAISGTGESSTTSSPRVLTVTTESLPEGKILLTNVTATSVSLLCRIPVPKVKTFDDESADRGYVVLIYSDHSDIFTDVVFEAWPLRYQFKSLKPRKFYHIRVVSNEMGAYYETTVTTRPRPVSDIWIHSISNSSVTLQWNHISPQENLYEINLTPNYQRIVLPIRTSQNKVSLHGLVPKATYSVTVATIFGDTRSDPVEILVTPGVDEPTEILTSEELSCLGPIIAASCLAGVLLLVFIYVVKTCITHNGKHIQAHHAEENEYENPNRPSSIYSAQYQNTSNSRRESTNQPRQEPRQEPSPSPSYPPLHLRIMPRRPKLRRIGYVENGPEDDEIPMYYNLPKQSELPD